MKDSKPWFRIYAAMLDDPKVQTLPDAMFRLWINLLCVARRHNGVIPDLQAAAFLVRMRVDRYRVALAKLESLGLIDRADDGTLSPHNWQERQFESDASAERTRRYRDRKRDGDVTEDVNSDGGCDVTVTPSETDTDTEEEKRERKTRARGGEPDPESTTTTTPPTFTQGIPNDSPFNPQVYPPSSDDVVDFGAKIGVSRADCEAFWLHFAQQGWKRRNDRAIVDWSLALRSWKVDNDAGLAPKRKGATGGNAGKDDRVAKPLSQEAAISECSRTGRTLTELPRLKNRNGRAEYVSWFERSYAIPNTHEPWPWEVPS